VTGLAIISGVGFTVSLLIGELAFGLGSARDDHVKVAVLTGSLAAALLATGILRLRNRSYRRISEAESAAQNGDRLSHPDESTAAAQPGRSPRAAAEPADRE
jgi:NhaA family Na+:H+ antiporter